MSYVGIFKMHLKGELQYRGKAISGIVTQVFWGFMRISLFTAFLATSSMQDFSLYQMSSYIWLGQAFLAAFYITVPPEVNKDIVRGDICYKFIRPMDIYNQWYASVLGSKIASTLLRFSPIIILGFCLPSSMGLMLPVSFEAFLLFCVSMCIGVCLCSAVILIAIYLSIKTLMPKGASAIVMSITSLLSGALIPLPLMPASVQTVLNFLPFRYMSDLPFRIYIGNFTIAESCMQIGIAFVWLVVLIVIGKLLMKSSLKKVVVQGG